MVSVRHFAPVSVALACLCVLLLAPPVARANVPGTSTTRPASHSADGGFPNGRSQKPAIAQDRKAASLVAYDSVATNIVGAETNGVSDVFAVHRAQPYRRNATHATHWEPGAIELISKAMDGGPAAGPSYLPDLDGDQLHDSHCVAFVSAADNLVPGDTNGQPDAFVRDCAHGHDHAGLGGHRSTSLWPPPPIPGCVATPCGRRRWAPPTPRFIRSTCNWSVRRGTGRA